MIERLEVNPGPGTVIRYGSVAAWAAPTASPGLISFLAVSARNLAGSPAGGRQLAEHLAGVLEARDPEPHVAFAVVGPSEDGWMALLHGPVQIWDGRRWVMPDRVPGWRQGPLVPAPSLAVTSVPGSAPAVSPDSMWDLEAGVVPGRGFVLLPARSGVPGAGSRPRPEEGPGARLSAVPAPDSAAGRGGPAPAAGEDSPAVAGEGRPGAVSPGDTSAAEEARLGDVPIAESPDRADGGTGQDEVRAGVGAGREVQAGSGTGTKAPAGAGPAGHNPRAPSGVVDLRSAPARVVAYPPLPSGRAPGRPGPGSPVVTGVLCRHGHLNRPGMAVCVRCAVPISDEDAYNVSGTRPALGCLVLDDGSVYRLDIGYIAGSEPERDPTVRGGLGRPLRLPEPQVAASHAEIRLHDWDVVLTDRDSTSGTFLYGPDSAAWERLRPYQPQVLQPGTHIAFGQRVATFLSPWMTGARPPGPGAGDPYGQDVRDRYFGQ